jgi:hypothetical protein
MGLPMLGIDIMVIIANLENLEIFNQQLIQNGFV